jgi:hypothetical protein
VSNDGIESLMSGADPERETEVGPGAVPGVLPGALPDADAAADAPMPSRTRRPWLGITAVALVVLVVIVDAIAIGLAYTDQYETSIIVAFVAIALAVVSFCLGLAAFILRAGRWWGLVAMPLSLLVNPYLLAGVLALVSNISRS